MSIDYVQMDMTETKLKKIPEHEMLIAIFASVITVILRHSSLVNPNNNKHLKTTPKVITFNDFSGKKSSYFSLGNVSEIFISVIFAL